MNAPELELLEMDGGRGKVYLGANALSAGSEMLSQRQRRIFLLTDDNTRRDCYPLLAPLLSPDIHLTIPHGERNKTLEHCAAIWQALTEAQFERGDLLVNLGGGMVCDIGGFAASTYKRGIPFVHIPTTLLAMADAAIGGKTGIDFLGYKNQIGSFQQPLAVIVQVDFLKTLPPREVRSGFAEVLKHLLIHDRAGWESFAASPQIPCDWLPVVAKAIRTKMYFTEADPLEKSIRKALNFGHTVGHAIESHFLAQPDASVLHGEAVAAGMWCEAESSHQKGFLTAAETAQIQAGLAACYPKLRFERSEIPAIAAWCQQDKKNQAGQIKSCLLHGIGDFKIDVPLTLSEIEAILNQYLDHYP